MQLDESLALIIIFKDDYAPGVAAYDQEILLHPEEPEGHYFPNDSEAFLPVHHLHLASLLVESEHLEDLGTLGDYELVLVGT